MKINFKALIIGSVLIGIFLLSGCHTVKGLGQDIQKGGEVIQKAANTSNNNTPSNK